MEDYKMSFLILKTFLFIPKIFTEQLQGSALDEQ